MSQSHRPTTPGAAGRPLDGLAAQDAPILVGIDFSAGAALAAHWAARLAAVLGAPLVLVHVVHDPGSAPGSYAGTGIETPYGTLEEAGERLLEGFVEELHAGHPDLWSRVSVESHLVVGLPATRLIEAAKKVGAQLVVVGSRGRTGVKRLLLGSTASKVVQLAKLPVTVVPTPKKKGKKSSA
ncbi:MAG: universal stress protein [Gemmatimonadetes bacterium]|nr:universal stress protein [Gemmatimonadota bacterium]